MKIAAPAELAAIMGKAMTSTSWSASGKGRATSRMMIICRASATIMVRKAVRGLRGRSEP